MLRRLSLQTLKIKILGVVARKRSTSRLVNPCHSGGSGSETTKREAEPLQGPMLAIRERSVSLIAASRATLIVIYTGVSLIFTLAAIGSINLLDSAYVHVQ